MAGRGFGGRNESAAIFVAVVAVPLLRFEGFALAGAARIEAVRDQIAPGVTVTSTQLKALFAGAR